MTISRNRNSIINGALEIVGVKESDEDAKSAYVSIAATALDKMVKSLQGRGARLWTCIDAHLFLVTGQAKYVLGATADATESYTETVTTGSVAAGIKVIPMDTTGLTVGDFLGVKLDDGELTFSPVTVKTATSATITTGLTTVAASGNKVYFYTIKLGKALRVPDARFVQSGGNTIDMKQMAREDYLLLPNKTNQGTPTQFYYNPKVSTGEMFIWPTPTATQTLVNFTYYKPLDVFETSDSDADFPDEWIEALEYQLAVRLCARFVQPVPKEVAVLAISLLKDAMDWDQGDADVVFAYGR